ncbi:MAG TPA: efflux RND transporter periplasmic adaptor subunit [Candidatus Acidoferrum sp.]|nr:efflux RND transporter periplasmic adaptor subunit [Candidatus Acidoferrum sp.]
MANPKKRRKVIIFAGIGLVLVVLTLVAVFRKKEPVITVQTEKVIRTNIVETVVANGKIYPVVQVHISPEVSGEIIELPVKEGQRVKKGDLLVKIKPDVYVANRNQADASYKSSLASQAVAKANLEKAETEYKRAEELFRTHLISESDYIAAKTSFDSAQAQVTSAGHQAEMAKASLASAEEELAKTTILSPLDGTISKLNSQLGERVLGTVQNAGTDIMVVSDLNTMEARVDVGEMDVVLIKPGQNVALEVDSFKDQKFTGTVTDVASSSEGLNSLSAASSSSTQEATKFEIRIRINDKEAFRPGMSVTGNIETRSATNVLAVPFASVTARPPKAAKPKTAGQAAKTNSVATAAGPATNPVVAAAHPTNAASADPGATNATATDKKPKEGQKLLDVVFVVEGDHVKMMPVKTGISDETHWEITDGLKEGDEIVSGGFRAISRDLDDGKKIHKGAATGENPKS